jgi:hypothetical protein
LVRCMARWPQKTETPAESRGARDKLADYAAINLLPAWSIAASSAAGTGLLK